MSCPSGPRHRIFGDDLPSFMCKACLCVRPAHCKSTELPSGTTASEGSIVNSRTANRQREEKN